jgi:hypothetical protein
VTVLGPSYRQIIRMVQETVEETTRIFWTLHTQINLPILSFLPFDGISLDFLLRNGTSTEHCKLALEE